MLVEPEKNKIEGDTMKEFRADIGQNQYIDKEANLLQALRQLANALGIDKAYCNSEDFFRDFMCGFWEPFDEVSRVGNQEQSKLNEEIKAYRALIEAKINPETKELLDHYTDLLGGRNGEALSYAFLVGYQSAFRFILLGLSKPSEILPEGVS